MRLIKKIITLIGSIAAIGAPALTMISCSKSSFFNKGYDFGIAIPPINNLNYVKYDSLAKITPTLIQGLIQDGPGEALKNKLQLPQFTYEKMRDPDFSNTIENGGEPIFSGTSGTSVYTLSDTSTFAGNVSNVDGFQFYQKNGRGVELIGVSLNGVQKWKGSVNKFNRVIEAQDYIDYIKYITNINVGSLNLVKIQELKIKGIDNFINAQNVYAREFGATYKNPWGKLVVIKKDSVISSFDDSKFWPSQQNGDEKLVANIKNAALEFLLMGMRTSSTGINGVSKIATKNNEIKSDASSTSKTVKVKQKTDDWSKTDFFIRFENQSQSPYSFQYDLSRALLPINKSFVDEIGGIEKFGTLFNKWQYTSPFNIVDIRLGQGGYIDLEKDKNWFTAQYTISNKIKIYFNDQPNVLSSMFEDKYISATDIPAIYQSKFWTVTDTRQFMKKSRGNGTLAIQLNLDKETNGDSPLQNENFRNAIAHAIDRWRLLKLLNWDASFPITTWTPGGGLVKSSDGRSIDDFLSSEMLTGPHRKKPYSLTASTWTEHTATNYKFENTNRQDNRFNLIEARAYFDAYQNETGNNDNVDLTFLSSDTSTLNAGLGIKSMLDKAFGTNKIKIIIKSVPINTYETMRSTGQFDLTTYNFDEYGSSINSYMKHLFVTDALDSKKYKTHGFINNPSASWTFYDWFKYHKFDTNESAKVQYEEYFQIPVSGEVRDIWEKLLEIIELNPKTHKKELSVALNKIWNLNDSLIHSDEKLFRFISLLEKIVALSSPVIPLLDVDNTWFVSRLYGIKDTYTYSLQYAYDVLNKPNPSLPGRDVLINENA